MSVGAMGPYSNGDRPPRRFGRSSGVSALRQHLNELAAADPEAIKLEVIAQGRDPFIEGLVEALSDTGRHCYSCHRSGKEKWAFRLYAELAEMVGSGPEIGAIIINQIGASAPVARGAVESMERAKGMTQRQRLEMHMRACREAGCKVEPPADWSEAEVLTNGNGHTNGGGHA